MVKNGVYWRCSSLVEQICILGNLLSLISRGTVGVLVPRPILQNMTWNRLLYALLSLTIIRMLPVFIALFGLKMCTKARLSMGWFAPGGLASVVFAAIVLNTTRPGAEKIIYPASITIVHSILLLGLTANPWVRGFARREQQRQRPPSSAYESA